MLDLPLLIASSRALYGAAAGQTEDTILDAFPAMSDANDASYIKLGTAFEVSYGSARNARISGARIYRPSGATDTIRVYLYGNDGTKLVDEEVASYTAGTVTQVDFASPVDYDTADSAWMIAYATPDGVYGYNSAYFGGGDVVDAPITLPQGGSFTFNSTTGRNGMFATSDIVPNSDFNETFYGIVPVIKYDPS